MKHEFNAYEAINEFLKNNSQFQVKVDPWEGPHTMVLDSLNRQVGYYGQIVTESGGTFQGVIFDTNIEFNDWLAKVLEE